MTYFFITLTGLIFGSFASVIIHRLHHNEKGVFWGHSKCPHCHHRLSMLDLIPILSYLLTARKCRYCKKIIPFRYPLMELSTAGLFLLTSKLVELQDIWLLVFYLFIAFIFILLTFYDFLYKEVPDEISLTAIAVSLIYMIGRGEGGLSLALGISFPLVFFGFLYLASKGRWLGGGDIRIGILMGILLGWPMVLLGLFLGYLTGAMYSLAGLIMKKFTRKSQIPFVPFLLSGTYIAIFWGTPLIQWYKSLLF